MSGWKGCVQVREEGVTEEERNRQKDSEGGALMLYVGAFLIRKDVFSILTNYENDCGWEVELWEQSSNEVDSIDTTFTP